MDNASVHLCFAPTYPHVVVRLNLTPRRLYLKQARRRARKSRPFGSSVQIIAKLHGESRGNASITVGCIIIQITVYTYITEGFIGADGIEHIG